MFLLAIYVKQLFTKQHVRLRKVLPVLCRPNMKHAKCKYRNAEDTYSGWMEIQWTASQTQTFITNVSLTEKRLIFT